MKIRIKRTKKIKEISAAGGGAVVGAAGPFIQKKKLDEDGPIAANTFGASMKDRHLQSKDERDTFEGQKERNDHNPYPNRAIDPQGKLLGEEELEEGSMMGTVGTASEPEDGSGHTPFDGEADVGDWEFHRVRERRAKKKLNRVFAPWMKDEEMRAHIDESASFDDMDSVDREFFADRPTIGNDGSISNKPSTTIGDPLEIAKESLKKKGYTIERELGKGMNGTVYKAKNSFKKDCAIKIVIGDQASKELSNYEVIGAARSANALIAKHFPNVMEAWSPGNKISIIVMEILQPLSDAQATFIPDASYLAGKNKAHRLAVAADSYSGMRDMSQRFTHYIQNNIQEVSAMFEYGIRNLILDYNNDWRGKLTAEKVQSARDEVSSDSLLQIMKIEAKAPQMSKQYFDNRKSSMARILGAGSDAVAFLEILEEESPNSLGANAALAEISFRIMLVGLMAQLSKDEIDAGVRGFAKSFLESARQFTQMPMGYEVPDVNEPKKTHEKWFLTSKGLHSAIKALYDQTGLLAKDLHDQNVMANASGDLVIVDVGLFRPDSGWKGSNNLQEMLRIRKKMLRNLRK